MFRYAATYASMTELTGKNIRVANEHWLRQSQQDRQVLLFFLLLSLWPVTQEIFATKREAVKPVGAGYCVGKPAQ